MGAIIVCGEGRCGTSLCMQTLKLLGVEVAAPDFTEKHKGLEQYNPKGFYENELAYEGIQTNEYDNKAVKLFAAGLKNTDKKYIGKVIRMKRDRVDCCISYAPILAKIETTELTTFQIYDINCEYLDNYLANCNHLTLIFEEFLENPLSCIEQIVDFLEIEPSLSQIKEAYNNVEIVTKLK